jgi:hypothetical protein
MGGLGRLFTYYPREAHIGKLSVIRLPTLPTLPTVVVSKQKTP